MLGKLVVWPLLFSIFFGAIGARAASGFSGDPVAVEEAAQSVLMLEVYNQGQLIATGSGFIAFERDMLVTNSHVIDGADEILAKSDQGYEYVMDKIYAVDAKKDLAILGLSSPTDLPTLAARTNGGVMRVEPVVAIGSPKGHLNTVSVGNVSAVFTEDGTRYIQFTAPVSSGSSGGALFNNDGEVIGITTSALTDDGETVQNLNFAIHISEAAALRERVDEGAWIPVRDYPAFQKTAADFPGDAQAAYDADRNDMPLLSYADGALKRDKAHAFDVLWQDLETVLDGYRYYLVTVREGSTPYTLYAGLSEDGVAKGVFVMDAADPLLKDSATIAILRDLGDALIRASGGDDDGLVKNLRDFRRHLDGYKTGKIGEAFELYGDTAYFLMRYDEGDAQNPAAITLAFGAYSALGDSALFGPPQS